MKGLKRVISLIILCVIMAGNLFSQGSPSKKYIPMATSDLT